MSLSVEWGNEQKTFILITYHGPWTWQDFDAGADRSMQMVASVDHVVDVIVDAQAHPHPPDSNAMPHFQRIRQAEVRNAGRMVIVGSVSFMQWIMNITGRVLGWPGGMPRFVKTMEEAEAFLAERHAQSTPLSKERAS